MLQYIMQIPYSGTENPFNPAPAYFFNLISLLRRSKKLQANQSTQCYVLFFTQHLRGLNILFSLFKSYLHSWVSSNFVSSEDSRHAISAMNWSRHKGQQNKKSKFTNPECTGMGRMIK